MAKEKRSFYGTGRRKGSVALVLVRLLLMVEMFKNICLMTY